MEREHIDLLEFQSRLKKGIEGLFPSRFWLKAEVSSVKARPGGHCWMELSQSSGDGLVAKANAVIWSSRYRFIAPYFESVAGSPIQEGMTVLMEVQANYSELYGFSLVVSDIDPEYSLGIKEMERQRTIERLRSEGLLDLQKDLPMPLLPYRLAVISAEDAAGYRDFIRHLEGNPYGFSFCVRLYPALMQGAECPKSVISALDCILEDGWCDVVMILRGGGGKLDLSCYDDYEMAAVIAQFPLPVLVAVGHDQDYHVCDMVANVSVKTPTALADYLIGIYEDEDARLSALRTRMKLAVNQRLSQSGLELDRLRLRIRGAVGLRLERMESALELLRTRICAADPRKILDRGYSLILDSQGVVVKDARTSKTGDRISVVTSDVVMECTVDAVLNK